MAAVKIARRGVLRTFALTAATSAIGLASAAVKPSAAAVEPALKPPGATHLDAIGAGAYGHAISTTHPAPGRLVNLKPCNFTIAATRFRPRPRPDVCLTLSDR